MFCCGIYTAQAGLSCVCGPIHLLAKYKHETTVIDKAGAALLDSISFANSRLDAPGKLVAFAGSDARVTQSGKFAGTRRKISKRGSPYLRRAVWLAASRAAFSILSEHYQSLRAQGKHRPCRGRHIMMKYPTAKKPSLNTAQSFRLPMTVTEIHLFRNRTAYPVCPRCRMTLEREYQGFCDRCGQALNWRSYKKLSLFSSLRIHSPNQTDSPQRCSTDFSFVLCLADIFTRRQLDPIHLLDVIEDLL